VYAQTGQFPVSIAVNDIGGSTAFIQDQANVSTNTPEPRLQGLVAAALGILIARRWSHCVR
jgi:hypothetical protein